VHFGNSISVTKSFAGNSPGKGGDHGSAHILVRTRQHTERYARNRPFRIRKNVPLFHQTMCNRGEWVMARRGSLWKARRAAYRFARDLGNVEAGAKGPASYGKRVVRRKVLRKTNTATSRFLRRLGL